MWGRVRLPRTFAALRHRNFRLFYFGQLLSLIGTWMQDTARGWLVVLLALPAGASLAQAAGGTDPRAAEQANLYLSLIATAGNLPVLFGSLYGGILADRRSKRTIIVWAQAAQMCLAFGLAALVGTGQIAVWHVVLFAALVGVTNVFDIPARQSFLVEMVGRADLPNAIALQSSIFNGARALGPALAGVLIAALSAATNPLAGLAQCFFWNGVSYLFVLAGLLLMRGDFSPKSSGAPGTPLSALREVKVFLWGRRPALLLVSLVAVFSLFNAPFFVLLPSLAKFTLGVDAGRFGILMSAQGVGALVAALAVATLSGYQKKGRILMGASLALPVLTLLLTVTRAFPLACLLMLGIGFAIISFLATANALLQTSTPDALRGRVMSLYSLILVGLTPVGSLWSGAVAKAWGAPVAVAVGSSVILAASVFALLRYPALATRTTSELPAHL